MRFTKATRPLQGKITVPGDKSISHRAVMFGSIAEGATEITGFLPGADCLSTISCFRQMGIEIELSEDGTHVLVHGKGLHGLQAPADILDCGNSGTTMRLMSGILAGQPFSSVLTGDASIRKRPMNRIIRPLREMGADIRSEKDSGCAPLRIESRQAGLRGITYHSPVASAQVKSGILLAGLYADSPVIVAEPALSRNHTELMLRSFGAELYTGPLSVVARAAASPSESVLKDVSLSESASAENLTSASADLNLSESAFSPFLSKNALGEKLSAYESAALPSAAVLPDPVLKGISVQVPGDISSAAYFLCAALLVPGSHVILENVGINPTRDGILRVAAAMGADITIFNRTESGGEPAADLEVRSAPLHGTVIEGDLIPTLIDELPVIAVLAACADGDTVIRDAAELRVKESDRLAILTENLTAMGASVEPLDDGMIIHGGKPLHGAVLDSCGDHRIAMSFAVAALLADGITEIRNAECVDISYPGFYADLTKLQ